MRKFLDLRWCLVALALLHAGVGAPVCWAANPPRVLVWVEALKGTSDDELRWPVAVAAASSGEFAVADAYGPRLFRFRKQGVSWQLVQVVALSGRPVALVHDGSRYVATLRSTPALVTFAGEQLIESRIQLSSAVVPGALALGLDGGYLLYDLRGSRVLELTREGDSQRRHALDVRVTALAAYPGGGFVAAVPDQGALLRFDTSGKLVQTWSLPAVGPVPAWPVGLALEPSGEILALDRHGGQILVLAAKGAVAGVGSRQGWEPGLLLFPSAIARLPDGLLVVADEGNERVQFFRRTDRGSAP